MTTLNELRKSVLEELHDRWANYREEFYQGDPHEVIHEIADSSVPVYNTGLIELSGDPEVGHHECELPPAFDGKPTIINIAATAVFELLEEALWVEWQQIKDDEPEEGSSVK